MPIGAVARQAGVTTSTLRYYEDSGLLRPANRVGGQRRYDRAALTRLELIGLCKAAGFTLDEIRLLLTDDAPGRPQSRALAASKLDEIDTKVAELAKARAIVEWGMACTCPSIDACSCGIHAGVATARQAQ